MKLTAAFFVVASTYSATALEHPGISAASDPITDELLEASILSLYNEIGLKSFDVPVEVFRLAMVGYYNLHHDGKIGDKGLLSIIDFSKPSTQKRFYTIDLKQKIVKFHTYVSHGKNTGENMAVKFSNTVHSNQSSLGFYVTGETYVGSKGYSLRLDGMDKGYNDNMRRRAVVMHDASYVSEWFINKYGRLGRSQGCPALPKEICKEVIDTIKEKTPIFAYYNDDRYLASSFYLDTERLLDKLNASPEKAFASASLK